MKRILFLFVLTFSPWSCFAVVNMKNANFSDKWVDLSIPSSGYDLEIERTYNSRTLHNGLFGFGWCSDFETKLKVTPDGNINIIECGGGSKVVYISEKFIVENYDFQVKLGETGCFQKDFTLGNLFQHRHYYLNYTKWLINSSFVGSEAGFWLQIVV